MTSSKPQIARGMRSDFGFKIRNLQSTILLIVYCLLFTGYLLLPTGCTSRVEEEKGVRTSLPEEGDIAPSFSITLLDGGEFKLGNHKGKPMVVNFWASWCKPCRDEAPALEKVYTRYRDKGVGFIGIAIYDTEEKAREYIKEFGITFPNGLDKGGSIAEVYKIYGIPKTFIVGKDGRFTYIHMGAVTEDILIKGIEKVL